MSMPDVDWSDGVGRILLQKAGEADEAASAWRKKASYHDGLARDARSSADALTLAADDLRTAALAVSEAALDDLGENSHS